MRRALLAAALAVPLVGACADRPQPAPAPSAPTSPPPGLPVVQHVWKEGRRAPDSAPVLVVLHGMGDRPEGILPVVVDYPHPLQTWAPQAPAAMGPGYTWFSAGAAARDPAALCAELQAAADRLASDLALLDLGARGRPVAVTGFSQGGMLSLMLALHHPGALDASFPLAAYLPAPCLPEGPPPPDAPPIRAFHGLADDRLPVENMQRTVATLQERGWDVTLQTYPGLRHSLDRAVQADLFAAITATLPAPD